MQIIKELSDIALPITEPEYRQMPELSYSTLSSYERVGYDGLDHLFDKVESPSLTLGSVVDTIITGGEDEFNANYKVVDIILTDSGKDICKNLIEKYPDYEYFEDIPEDIVSNVAKETGFWKADKWDKKRYEEVLKTGNIADYYDVLKHNEKIIIDTDTYNDAVAMARVLRESDATRSYFADNDEWSPVRRYYQLKFKAKFRKVGYRCMADLIVVNYEKKKIFPIDLKTSSHTEWNFEESFVKWSYMIQARLYWRIIKANLYNDPYFKDFELENYKFIVVNKKTLTPLVWEFPLTQSMGTLVDSKGNRYRDPFEIGEELRGYLDAKPQVPKGINKDGVNTITCLKALGDWEVTNR